MRLNGHTVNQGHYDDLSDLDAPGPSNLMSSRSMSEADRRKREITTPARLPWGYPQESAASLATRRTSVPFAVLRPTPSGVSSSAMRVMDIPPSSNHSSFVFFNSEVCLELFVNLLRNSADLSM